MQFQQQLYCERAINTIAQKLKPRAISLIRSRSCSTQRNKLNWSNRESEAASKRTGGMEKAVEGLLARQAIRSRLYEQFVQYRISTLHPLFRRVMPSLLVPW